MGLYIEVTQPNTTTDGSNGNDSIFGTSSWDVINGVAGHDLLVGGGGDDVIFGGTGNDTIQGGEGDDALIGNQGDDLLQGGNGNDLLQGYVGSDILNGGNGADIFDMLDTEAKTRTETVYRKFFGIRIPVGSRTVTYFDDIDVIQDFDAAEGDMVRIYEFEMSGNLGDFSTSVSNGDTNLMFKGATFAVLEGVTNFNLSNDLELNPG
ncbi:calcium-binding protein [Dapis sp. BLCC M229]|uniref:calcium-binding protein n=1 Tax=Dapis sp. BLCC M229 TaxID=3400188 RepID=UPI003CFB32EB